MVQLPVEPAISEYLHRKAVRAGIPLSGTFELTPVCNMSCKMCYVRMSRQQQESIAPLRSAQEWIEMAKAAKGRGMLYLLLTGGEPFLHPQFREIMTELHKMGFIISINSNGTMIDENTVAWLKKVPPTRVNVTLYGASDATYERLCGNPRGFSQVTKAIRLLTDAKITVKLNCSVTPHNVHDLEAIFSFAKKNKLIVQATSYMFPPLRRDPSLVGRNDRFSPEEAAYYTSVIELLSNGEAAFLAKPERDLSALRSDVDEDCLLDGNRIWCRAGKSSFWVTWTGEMLPCGMIPCRDSLNVFVDGFSDAWDRTKEISEGIRLPVKCAGCSLRKDCRACAAMVLTESGCFDQIPEYRCQMTRAFFVQRDKLKSEISYGHV